MIASFEREAVKPAQDGRCALALVVCHGRIGHSQVGFERRKIGDKHPNLCRYVGREVMTLGFIPFRQVTDPVTGLPR